jgi:hypothetical protein
MRHLKVSFLARARKITRRYDDNFQHPTHNPACATHKFESEELE